jgi:hypothetical protein
MRAFAKEDESASPFSGSGPERKQTKKSSDSDTFMKLNPRDCDDILKLMFEKQSFQLIPEQLQGNPEVTMETAETAGFLRQHLNDQTNELYKITESETDELGLEIESRSFQYSPWSNYLEGNAFSWNFDMLKFRDLTQGQHVLEFGKAMFKRFGILKTLNTDALTATNFLRDVSDSYLPNPYHNSIHGADVANASAYFISSINTQNNFTELEVSCLLISALVHDLGHPGVNNPFLVATKSREAMICIILSFSSNSLDNDQSVLENFHIASFYKVLQKKGSNILSGLTEKDYKQYRKLSVGMILDTGNDCYIMFNDE